MQSQSLPLQLISFFTLSSHAFILQHLSLSVLLVCNVCLFQERYTVTRLCLHPKLNQFIAQTQGSYAAIFSTERPYKMNKNTRFEGHKVRNQHAVWRNTLKPYTLKVLFSRWMSLFMVFGCCLWIEWNIYLQLPFIKILHRTLNSKAWLFISRGNKVCS